MNQIWPPPPFDILPRQDVDQITLRHKQTLFYQGAKPYALFFVTSGAVILERHTEGGQKVVLHRAQGGDLIAEASLFSDAYHCDCIAETDATLIALNKKSVLRLMTSDPTFASSLVAKMARQVQRYRRQLELRAITPAIDRVFAGLSDGWLAGSVMQFAGDLGLSHEATYRALSVLVTEGRVWKVGRGKYSLRRPDVNL